MQPDCSLVVSVAATTLPMQTDIDRLELDASRRAIELLKEEFLWVLPSEEIQQRLRSRIDEADEMWRALVAESQGAFRPCVCELEAAGMSWAEFSTWNWREIAPGWARAQHPEHYNFGLYEWGLFIVEPQDRRIGKLIVRPEDPIDLPEAPHPDYPHHVMFASVSLDDRTVIGHIAHQARDAAGGMRLRASLYFPSAAPDSLIREHQEHFAVEMRKLIEMVAQG